MKDIFDFSNFSVEEMLKQHVGKETTAVNYDNCSTEKPLTMAFVNVQDYNKTYEPDSALTFGTLFPELNKPFCRGNGEWGAYK